MTLKSSVFIDEDKIGGRVIKRVATLTHKRLITSMVTQ